MMFILNHYENREFLKTNRMLFINDKFYPIVFETDYLFYAVLNEDDNKPILGGANGIDISMPTIREREKMEFYDLKKKKLIFDHYTYWIIDTITGKLIETNASL